MIGGVEIFDRRLSAGDDAPRAAIGRPRRFHGVFAVIAARLTRQTAFAITEDAVVLSIRVRAALLDQTQRVDGFSGQKGRVARRR